MRQGNRQHTGVVQVLAISRRFRHATRDLVLHHTPIQRRQLSRNHRRRPGLGPRIPCDPRMHASNQVRRGTRPYGRLPMGLSTNLRLNRLGQLLLIVRREKLILQRGVRGTVHPSTKCHRIANRNAFFHRKASHGIGRKPARRHGTSGSHRLGLKHAGKRGVYKTGNKKISSRHCIPPVSVLPPPNAPHVSRHRHVGPWTRFAHRVGSVRLVAVPIVSRGTVASRPRIVSRLLDRPTRRWLKMPQHPRVGHVQSSVPRRGTVPQRLYRGPLRWSLWIVRQAKMGHHVRRVVGRTQSGTSHPLHAHLVRVVRQLLVFLNRDPSLTGTRPWVSPRYQGANDCDSCCVRVVDCSNGREGSVNVGVNKANSNTSEKGNPASGTKDPSW
jgi:hypothetical protein